jgi:hypothetical protein
VLCKALKEYPNASGAKAARARALAAQSPHKQQCKRAARLDQTKLYSLEHNDTLKQAKAMVLGEK